MIIYLTKDENQSYIKTTEHSIFSEMEKLPLNETLVDFYVTYSKLLETFLIMKWEKFIQNSKLILPLEEMIAFRSTCKTLEQIAEIQNLGITR